MAVKLTSKMTDGIYKDDPEVQVKAKQLFATELLKAVGRVVDKAEDFYVNGYPEEVLVRGKDEDEIKIIRKRFPADGNVFLQGIKAIRDMFDVDLQPVKKMDLNLTNTGLENLTDEELDKLALQLAERIENGDGSEPI